MEFTAWDRVRIAREMDRPTSLYYIEHIFENFMELHRDRGVKDDPAIVGGIGFLDGFPVTVSVSRKVVILRNRWSGILVCQTRKVTGKRCA